MAKTYNICLLPGDGIGPESIAEGCKVLDAVGAKYDTAFSCTEALLGGCAIDATGTALPDETLRAAEASDAVLLAGFTEDWKGLLLGTDVGGLGTIIASLASLISFKLYCAVPGSRAGKYMLYFTVVNVAALVLLIPLSLLIM